MNRLLLMTHTSSALALSLGGVELGIFRVANTSCVGRIQNGESNMFAI